MKSIYENATARPWLVQDRTCIGGLAPCVVYDRDTIGGVIASLAMCDNSAANAKLIVHAVNNIERLEAINAELLEALTALLDGDVDVSHTALIFGDRLFDLLATAQSAAERAAIASVQRIIGESE